MQKIKKSTQTVKILLTGGGTAGSVTPLLAVAEEIRNWKLSSRGGPALGWEIGNLDFLWLGTKNGPERIMLENENIIFKSIYGGKLRRYFSWRNLIDLFFIKFGFYQSLYIILKWKPDLVMSAGSFVSVPVVWAAWLLRVPAIIHQQDAKPGLANKLMAPFAKVITVTFEKSLEDYGKKAVWTGNPLRKVFGTNLFEFAIWKKEVLNLKSGISTVLILGGGTGAVAINRIVEQSLGQLTKFCQIIHITGKGKLLDEQKINYKPFEFLNTKQMATVYSVADIVVSRGGMGALTELSYLGKPSILIPIPDSHQEDNAEVFYYKRATIVLDQNELTPEKFVSNIKKLLGDRKLRNKLSNNIKTVIKRGATERMAEIIKDIAGSL